MTDQVFDVVIPTVGRPSLSPMLHSLCQALPEKARIVVVDDRPRNAVDRPRRSRSLGCPDDRRITVVSTGGGCGPAAARNSGWRSSAAPWVVFLDDDVDIPLGWVRQLEQDLAAASRDAAAVQGRVRVPLPAGRRPSDWERNVSGLEDARWITADLAVRRSALEAIDGFDERFPRAYREDSDLALRLLDAGWHLEVGRRSIRHPVRPAPWWVSVELQRGNADDVLIEHLHGRGWRARLGAQPGTLPAHRVTVAVALTTVGAAATRRWRVATAAGLWWLGRTARFAWARTAPGPRTRREVAAMAVTSALIPPAACLHRLLGHLRLRRLSLTEISA